MAVGLGVVKSGSGRWASIAPRSRVRVTRARGAMEPVPRSGGGRVPGAPGVGGCTRPGSQHGRVHTGEARVLVILFLFIVFDEEIDIIVVCEWLDGK